MTFTEAERLGAHGVTLLRAGKYAEAVDAFDRSERLAPAAFGHFVNLAHTHLCLGQPDAALQVCDRGLQRTPDFADLHRLRGDALDSLGRNDKAREAFFRATATSDHAFTAAERLLTPLALDPSGSSLLALCDQFPKAYANCTIVRGFRAIGLSRSGREDEANRLVDLDRYVARIPFDPPAEFGGVERFNQMLAQEILANPGLMRSGAYGFHRTESLNVAGARAFPALATFLRSALRQFLAEFPRRGLDAILPPPPSRASLWAAGNVVRGGEGHHSHLHKFAYVSGVYHVLAPPVDEKERAGALVLGSCDDFTNGHVPCWGPRDVKPTPGVATLFPSHIFHSVVPTGREQLRIAVPFDLTIPTPKPATAGR